MLPIGLIMVLLVSLCVKLFDDKIRPYHTRKAIVNVAMISGLIFIIVGFIQTII